MVFTKVLPMLQWNFATRKPSTSAGDRIQKISQLILISLAIVLFEVTRQVSYLIVVNVTQERQFLVSYWSQD